MDPELFADEPAPPPYAPEEFDSKVNIAIQASLVQEQNPNHQPNQHHPQRHEKQTYVPDPRSESWEEWNEEAFEEAQRKLRDQAAERLQRYGRRPLPVPNMAGPSAPSTSSTSTLTRTLSGPRPRNEKERPSWLAEAGLASGSGQAPVMPTASVNEPEMSRSLENYSNGSPSPQEDNGLQPPPPPPFASSEPQANGPSYSETVTEITPVEVPSAEQPSGQYNYSPPVSPPPSVVSEDFSDMSEQLSVPSTLGSSNNHRLSMPPPVTSVRPISAQSQRAKSVYAAPPEPAVSSQWGMARAISDPFYKPQAAVNASALYNSSISSILAPHVPARPPQNLRYSAIPHGPNHVASQNGLANDYYRTPIPNQQRSPGLDYPTNFQQTSYRSPAPPLPPGAQGRMNPDYRQSGYGGWNA